jgi:hypothetical protein
MIDSAATGMGMNEQQLNHTNVVRTQVHFVHENQKMREKRPVEASGESPEPKSKEEGEIHTKTTIDENNTIIVKKYDEKGKLIKMVPPGYVPLSESV